jgi:hypothetical protein
MEKHQESSDNKNTTRLGVCPECKVRDGDSSKKKLYQCPYCGRWLCEKHIEPRIATTRGAIEQIRDPILRDKVLEEWRKPDGHPDVVWTKKYFEDLKRKAEEEREKIWEVMDVLKEIKERRKGAEEKIRGGERRTIIIGGEKYKSRPREINLSLIIFLVAILGVIVAGIALSSGSIGSNFNITWSQKILEKLSSIEINIPIFSKISHVPLNISIERIENIDGRIKLKIKVKNTGERLIIFIIDNPVIVLENGQQLRKISECSSIISLFGEDLYPNGEMVIDLCFPLVKKEDKPKLRFVLIYGYYPDFYKEEKYSKEYSIDLTRYQVTQIKQTATPVGSIFNYKIINANCTNITVSDQKIRIICTFYTLDNLDHEVKFKVYKYVKPFGERLIYENATVSATGTFDVILDDGFDYRIIMEAR